MLTIKKVGTGTSGLLVGATSHGLHVVKLSALATLLGVDIDEAQTHWFNEVDPHLLLVDHKDNPLITQHSLHATITALRFHAGISCIMDARRRRPLEQKYKTAYDTLTADLKGPCPQQPLWFARDESYVVCCEKYKTLVALELPELVLPWIETRSECGCVDATRPLPPKHWVTLDTLADYPGLNKAQRKIIRGWL